MNVTIYLESFSRAGGVRVVSELANTLAAHNHRCRIVTRDNQPPFFDLDSRVELEQSGSQYSFVRNMSFYFRILDIRPDIRITTSHRTFLCALSSPVCWRYRRRVVPLLQHNELLVQIQPRTGLIRYLDEGIFRLGILMFQRNAIFVSRWIQSSLNLTRGTKVSVGVTQTFINSAQRKARLTSPHPTVGAIVKKGAGKGYESYIRVINELAKKNDKLSFKVLSEDLVAKDFVDSNRVIIDFAANDDQVISFYKSVDIFIFLSEYEGFGLPPLEAYVCGCRVICNQGTGMDEYRHLDGIDWVDTEAQAIESIDKLISKKNTLQSESIEISGVPRLEDFAITTIAFLENLGSSSIAT